MLLGAACSLVLAHVFAAVLFVADRPVLNQRVRITMRNRRIADDFVFSGYFALHKAQSAKGIHGLRFQGIGDLDRVKRVLIFQLRSCSSHNDRRREAIALNPAHAMPRCSTDHPA